MTGPAVEVWLLLDVADEEAPSIPVELTLEIGDGWEDVPVFEL